MLRYYSSTRQQGAKYAALLGIAGFIDVPIVYLSIYWWRTVHPQPLVGPATSGGLDPSMQSALMISTLAFTLVLISLLVERMSLFTSQDALAEHLSSIKS